MMHEQLSALAQQAGATHYSPPPMRAVRGWSFTHEQHGICVGIGSSSTGGGDE